MTDPIVVSLVGLLGVVTGSILTSTITFINAKYARAHEERKQIRDIATQLGIKQWEAKVAEKIRRAALTLKQEDGTPGFLPDPELETIISSTCQLAEKLHQRYPGQGLFCRMLDCLRGDCNCKK